MGITPKNPADFDPTMGNYKDLRPFRLWCQKVLPLVYDDSLSYYEVLCKVVDYLNKAMEDIGVLHDDVDALHTAYQQLQSYVNDYFSTLDVQQEINNKLDAMASDGTLDALLLPYFNAYKTEINGIVAEQNENIEYFKSQINSTMDAQNEDIAVLESRMDGFASLTEGSTTGDAELQDIRVGANGVTYPTAGDAVRAQVGALDDTVNTYCDTNLYNDVTWTQGTYASLSFNNTTINPTAKRLSVQVTLPDNVYSVLVIPIMNSKFRGRMYSADGSTIDTVDSMQSTNWSKTSTVAIKYIRISYGLISEADISSYGGEIGLYINGYSTLQGVSNNIETLKNEVVNGRTGVNNKTYSSIGNAIRAQVGDLTDVVNTYCDTNLYNDATWSQGVYASLTFEDTTINASAKRLSVQLTLENDVYSVLIKPILGTKFRGRMYGADGSTIDTADEYQTTDWSKTSSVPIKYVRISYGFVSEDDISSYAGEIGLYVNGYSTLQGISDNVEKVRDDFDDMTSVNIPKIDTLIANSKLVRLDSTNIELGTLSNGEPAVSDVRARSINFINLTSGTVHVYCVNPNIEYSILAYGYDNSYKNATPFLSGENVVDVNKLSVYANKIKFLIKLKNYPFDMTDMDFDTLNTFTLHEPLNGANISLTLMSHNCGKFNYGDGGGYPSADVDEKVQDWKDMIIKYKPDIIFAQECSRWFDSNHTVEAYPDIYRPLLPFTYFVSYGRIMSKIKIGSVWQIDLTVSHGGETYSREAGCCIVTIDGVDIVLCSAHFEAGDGSPYSDVRELEKDALIAALSDYEHVIIGGDFNAQADSFYDDFVTAGYSCANHGYFGVYNTTTNGHPIDNIMVKGFSFYNVVVDADDSCTSDHIPVVTEVHISEL